MQVTRNLSTQCSNLEVEITFSNNTYNISLGLKRIGNHADQLKTKITTVQ